jgi:hypothetical protein
MLVDWWIGDFLNLYWGMIDWFPNCELHKTVYKLKNRTNLFFSSNNQLKLLLYNVTLYNKRGV